VLPIVLLVCFVVVIVLWLLSLLAAYPGSASHSPWLAFFAVLILGIVVFLTGWGVVIWRGPP